MKRTFFILYAIIVCVPLLAQKASVREVDVSIPTYGFSDADPVPMLATQPELYPYCKFSTYTDVPDAQTWRVVVLENDYLKVEILPEVGGKIWGITEKKTGYDIIYKNESLKFRNIATRGPWTSGGIEFNFGFFGHTPYAATPVSYRTEVTSTGDAVCLLGASDLPSRSDWRVKIILPADKAWVKMEYAWTNTSPYTHPYYYWTNAAVRAADDLKFDYPGTAEVGHGGDVHLFPVDEAGRDLSLYRNNAFGANKSYHIVGDNKPFKAVYWNDLGVGVGSLAEKNDLLGKKLWIWSMAPAGAIWEDLLTDSSGQYIEIQSGRLYNQASPESGVYTPYTQYALQPYQSDYWCEYWYPVVGTGGVSEAAKEGVMYINRSEKEVTVDVMALEKLQTKVLVRNEYNHTIGEQPINLSPTERQRFTLPVNASEDVEIIVEGTGLHYKSQDPVAKTKRPLARHEVYAQDTLARVLAMAEENFKYRRFRVAETHYKAYLQQSPYSMQVLPRLAEICIRTHRMDEANAYLLRALELDTYHGYSNFLFGLLSVAQNDPNTAEEAFSIASRNRAWTVASYIELARMYLEEGKHYRAVAMCREALLYDARNLNTLKLLALSYSASSQQERYAETLKEISRLDGLDTFVTVAHWLDSGLVSSTTIPATLTHNEFTDQLIVEQAISYATLGFIKEAITLFNALPDNPVALYWLAYLGEDKEEYLARAHRINIRHHFPFRDETYQVLCHVSAASSSWKIPYYKALFHWKWGDTEEAGKLFALCGNPDESTFYLVRAMYHEAQQLPQKATDDFRRYLSMHHSDWRSYYYLSRNLTQRGEPDEALKVARTGMNKFKSQFLLQYEYASLLLAKGNYKEVLRVLDKIVVLPAEHTGSAYPLYHSAHILQGLEEMKKGKFPQAITHFEASKRWPQHLGGGFGYTVDHSLQDSLINYCSGNFRKEEVEAFIQQQEIKFKIKN